MSTRLSESERGRAQSSDRMASRAGLKILVPGYAQWTWRQRERALVLFGSFVASLGVGVFAWGTHASLVILAFAFGTHLISAADVIRQSAFPGFGRWVPVASASAGLGLGVYAPTMALAMIFAWPGFQAEPPFDGYLINRVSYWASAPATGDLAWAALPGWRGARAVRVLAGAGKHVEWSASGLRVGGEGVPWVPPQSAALPRELAFTVPEGLALVAPEPTGRGETKPTPSCGLLLVDTRHIGGRAWARLYPIWERGLIR